MDGHERDEAPVVDPGGSQNPYQAPGQEAGSPGAAKPAGVGLHGLCIVWLLLFTLILVILIFVVPSFEAMFKDMGTGLPASTQTFLEISRFVRHPLGTLAAGLVILASIAFLWAPVKRGAKVGIYGILIAAAILFCPFVVISLFLPLIVTIQAVGGK
jgi:hypothetical protein